MGSEPNVRPVTFVPGAYVGLQFALNLSRRLFLRKRHGILATLDQVARTPPAN